MKFSNKVELIITYDTHKFISIRRLIIHFKMAAIKQNLFPSIY